MSKKPISETLLDSRQFLFKACEIGSGICDSLTLVVGDKILPLNIIHAAFKTGTTIIQAINKLNITGVFPKEWDALPADMTPIIFDTIKKYPNSVIFMNEWASISKYQVSDAIFFVQSGRNKGEPSNILYKKADKQVVFKTIQRIIWTKMSYMTRLAIEKAEYGISRYWFYEEQSIVGYQSEQYTELLTYLSLFLEKNISRSILLYGPPGTGKSTICKMIVNKLNLKTLIIPIEELDKITINNITNIIDLIMPEAVIIDDFDKSDHSPAILSVLELFAKRCKVVMATANDINYIKQKKYLVRPGRFDKLSKVDSIDSRVVTDLLGLGNHEFYDDVKNWPAAFIRELNNIITVLGKDRAREAIPDLEARVKTNRIYTKSKNKKHKSNPHVMNVNYDNEIAIKTTIDELLSDD